MIRKLHFVWACLAVAAAAPAQNVTFSYVYLGGNPDIEKYNGLSIGDELPSTLLVLPGNSRFKAGLKAKNNTATSARYGAGGLMLCFDSATTSNTNYPDQVAAVAAGVHKKLKFSNLLYAGEAGSGLPAVPKVDNSGADAGTGGITPLSKAYSGAYATGTSLRPIGIWTAFNFGTGLNLNLVAGGSAVLASMDVDIVGMADGDIFGDRGSETGMLIWGRTNAPTRQSYLGTPSGTGQQLQAKLNKIQAVPEPASLTALTLAALPLFRRKSKKTHPRVP